MGQERLAASGEARDEGEHSIEKEDLKTELEVGRGTAQSTARLCPNVQMEADTAGGLAHASAEFEQACAYGDAFVFFDNGGKSPQNKFETDDNGVSRITVAGAPQKEDLSTRRLFSISRQMLVRVNIQINPKIKSTRDAVSTGADLLGNALSFLTEDELGGSITAATETAYRVPAFSSAIFSFPVKDWEPCDNAWRGVISFEHKMRKALSGPITHESATDAQGWSQEEDEWFTVGFVKIAPDDAGGSGGKKNTDSGPHPIALEGQRDGPIAGSGKVFCSRRKMSTSSVHREECGASSTSRVWEDAWADARVHGSVSLINDKYGITMETPEPTGTIVEYSSSESHGPNCDGRTSHIGNGTAFAIVNVSLAMDGTVDPNNPDELKGRKLTPDGDGGTIKIDWNLQRCQQ